jgi:hypothetical protein
MALWEFKKGAALTGGLDPSDRAILLPFHQMRLGVSYSGRQLSLVKSLHQGHAKVLSYIPVF